MDEVKIYSKELSGDEIMQVVKDASLKGRWSFDEPLGVARVLDSSGNNNHGITSNHGVVQDVNTSSSWIAGKMGGGIMLNDGTTTGELIKLPKNESLNISEKITIMAWVKSPVAGGILMYMAGEADGSRLQIRVNVGGKTSLQMETADRTWHFGGESSTTHDWSGWHHVAMTYDSTTNTTKLYFDGVEDYSSTTQNTGPMSTSPLTYLRIGTTQMYTPWFSGGVDEVKIYDRDLSSDEIADIYEAENGD